MYNFASHAYIVWYQKCHIGGYQVGGKRRAISLGTYPEISVVAALTDLAGVRQQVVEMAAPARRVGAVGVDVAARPGCVEHFFDPAAQARRGGGGAGPHRLQRTEQAKQLSETLASLADEYARPAIE